MANIDKLTDNTVYADPVTKLQEEMLRDLLAIRKSIAAGIDSTLSSFGTGGNNGGAAPVSQAEFEKLVSDNKKLSYRVKHLVRALDEIDGKPTGSSGSSAAHGGQTFKLYLTESNSHIINQVLLAADLSGVKLEIVNVSEEVRASKPHQKMNPTGRYPLLETSEGTLAGVSAVVKYFSRASGKLAGKSVQEQSEVDQWVNWTQTTFEPTSAQVMKGVFGNEDILLSNWNEASKDLKAHCKIINNALEGKQWLVGNSMTLADVLVASTISLPL